MTTVRDIIRSAYRICGSLRSGADLDEVRANVGLERYRDMINSMISSGLLGRFNDIMKSDDYEICEWDRVIIPDDTVTITYPTKIYDPRHCGQYRQPRNWVPVIVVNQALGTYKVSIYNAMTAQWQDVTELDLGDATPFAPFSDKWLKALLAVDLVDELGLTMTKKLAHDAGVGKVMLASQYDQQRRSAQVEYF